MLIFVGNYEQMEGYLAGFIHENIKKNCGKIDFPAKTEVFFPALQRDKAIVLTCVE